MTWHSWVVTKLAYFANDYMATNMAKVRKFEDVKLSIQGKIVRFLLQYMDFMVRTTMAIERDRRYPENPGCRC